MIDTMDLEKAKQGKVTGVIIPPPEIRAVVDKTAQFVARNGKSFEQRILDSGEGKTSKFNFMKVYDPYHAYYELKISEFEGNKIPKPDAEPHHTSNSEQLREQEEPKTIAKPETAHTMATAKATITNPLAKFAMMKVTEPPPTLEFSAGHPSGLSSLDMDIMKLAAQYTALNGRDFLSGLAQREQRNPQFDFLKPTHMLFSYFTALVDAYAKLLQPSSALLTAVKEKSTLLGALEKGVERWVWECEEKARKKMKDKEADAERSALQAIDWHEFSIVETINFDEDELFEPAGMLSGGFSNVSNADSSRGGDEDMDMDEEMDEDMDEDNLVEPNSGATVNEEEDDDMKVVADYIPRTAYNSKGKEKQPTTMVDPISGKAIAIDQMSEHMRVQLMDPRWRIEQQRFLDKQQDTGFAEGNSIADSLKQFAKQRGDICGSAEEQEARILADEGKRKKRVEETNRIIWDGHQSSIESVKRQKLEQQMAEPRENDDIMSGSKVVGPTTQSVLPLASSSNSALQFHAPPASHFPPLPPPLMQVAPPLPPGISHAQAMGGSSEMEASFHHQQGVPPPIPFNQPVQSAQATLIPADEFASRYPSPVKITVNVPLDNAASWELRGQSLTVALNVTQSVKELKDSIGALIGGMPSNKQQLKCPSGFLKDKDTLASMNIGDGTVLELSVRSRGGKR